jgi:ferrochelatase
MKGVLLINLGSPKSPQPSDVYSYLQEFLLDPFVIDLPYLLRQLLVRGIIIPFRYKKSAKAYEKIWTADGGPLIYNSTKLAKAVQEELGPTYQVALGMRYGTPSIPEALKKLSDCKEIVILPLFPQYAFATTGSILQNCASLNAKVITHFYNHPEFIQAWADSAANYPHSNYDHVIFSYHGLPVRQLKKAPFCYKQQCLETTDLLTKRLAIPKDRYTISFQSRLGLDKWLDPFTIEIIKKRASLGDKKLLLFSPSFVADCLETTFELGIEAKEEFIAHGGETLDIVTSLNDSPSWVKAVCSLVKL